MKAVAEISWFYLRLGTRPAQNFHRKKCETQRWKLEENVTSTPILRALGEIFTTPPGLEGPDIVAF